MPNFLEPYKLNKDGQWQSHSGRCYEQKQSSIEIIIVIVEECRPFGIHCFRFRIGYHWNADLFNIVWTANNYTIRPLKMEWNFDYCTRTYERHCSTNREPWRYGLSTLKFCYTMSFLLALSFLCPCLARIAVRLTTKSIVIYKVESSLLLNLV